MGNLVSAVWHLVGGRLSGYGKRVGVRSVVRRSDSVSGALVVRVRMQERQKGSFVGAGRDGRLSLMVLCPGQLHFANAAFSVDRMGAFRVVDEHDRGAV